MIKHIYYVLALTMVAFAPRDLWAAETCARYLSPDQFQAEVNAFEARTGFDFSMLTTEPSLEAFYHQGLPWLTKIARDNGASIARIVQDQFALFHLGLESDEALSADQTRESFEFLDDLNGAFHDLERVLDDGRPTEHNAGQLARAEIFLRMVTFGVAMSQSDAGAERVLNPFADFDAEQVRTLMDAIDDGAFDTILTSFVEPEAPVQAPDTAAPASPSVEPAPVTRMTPPETDLARLLKQGGALEPNLTYRARTTRHISYEITFDKAVVKASKGRYRDSVQRLLRALFTGRGDNSGLMPLFAVGPGIVELKTVMHGHFRIIGCLDGGNLRLLRVMNIKETIQSYTKRIPWNLCAQP